MIAEALFTGAVRLWTGVTVRRAAPAPGGRPRVYYANHASHLDLPVVRAAFAPGERRRLRAAAAGDYWGATPVRRWVAGRLLNAVFIERRRVTRASNPIPALAAILQGGGDVLIFPEGTRGETGEPADFKSGLWHLARAVPEAELVPVWLENAARAMPKGESLPLPLLCAVSFGEPLADGLSAEREAFLVTARAALLALRAR